ncbi:MAG: hypothetical protein C5S38_07645 [Candidatus Methanophagaceae archaeon]|nr:MAG: hypothetical protein C5S38_07645 [Methanophagales archaeon]
MDRKRVLDTSAIIKSIFKPPKVLSSEMYKSDMGTIKNAVAGKAYMLQRRNTEYAAYIHGPAHEFPERLEER